MNKYLNKDGTLTKHSFSKGMYELYGLENKVKLERVSSKFHNPIFVVTSCALPFFFRGFDTVKEARKFARRHGKLDCVKLP